MCDTPAWECKGAYSQDPSMSCRPARMREASRCWGRPAPKGCVLHLRAVSGLRPPRLSTFEEAPVLHFVRRRAAGRQLTDATLLSPSGPVAAPALATHGGSCSRALQRPGIRLEFCPPLPPPLRCAAPLCIATAAPAVLQRVVIALRWLPWRPPLHRTAGLPAHALCITRHPMSCPACAACLLYATRGKR